MAGDSRVSIHAPVKGATGNKRYLRPMSMCFNSRTRKGCDISILFNKFHQIGFNSRTRKGCDKKEEGVKDTANVSIHAPVKGATVLQSIPKTILSVSIHAPVKGATIQTPSKKKYMISFNSRTRKGCDSELNNCTLVRCVSIHAPVKGATGGCYGDGYRTSFNSRTRKGCDSIITEKGKRLIVSIHAPVKGATRCGVNCDNDGSFNSRTRKGCDIIRKIGTVNNSPFQFTHP